MDVDTESNVTSTETAEVQDDLDLEGVDQDDFTEEELEQIAELKEGSGDDSGESGEDGESGEGGGEVDGGDREGKPPPGFVSINALHEARQQLKELKEEIGPLKQFKDQLALRLLEARKGKPEEKQEEIPDENKDPVGTIAWLKANAQRLEAELKARDNQTKEEREKAEKAAQQQEVESKRTEYVLETANTLLEKAVAKNPVVQEAFEAGVNGLRMALEKRGVPAHQMETELNTAVYQYAFNAPNDPDEFAEYVQANARYFGWMPGGKANGKTQGSAVEKISRLKKAQAASKTLGDGGGGGELSLTDMANMSAEELEDLAINHPELFEAAASRD